MAQISVVIPTHNRAKFLSQCLISLCQQDLDPALYEICAVNNASTDTTAQVVTTIAEHFPRHKLFLVDEPKLGLSSARNKGIASTHAPLIAFGDDDATMPPDWLARFVKRFDELGPEIGKIGGEIDPVWETPRPAWISKPMLGLLSASAGHGDSAKFCDYPIAECNSAYRREALAVAGNFPEHLGRIGNSLLSNEGVIDWIIRAKGYKLFYDPAIIIRHFIHADRLTPQWFRRRYFWQGVSDYIGIQYLNTHNLGFTDEIRPVLPLEVSDWSFMQDATITEQIDANLAKLRWLGFVLAMTGIIRVEGT
jgi:glycosyltransferase involved in cell wall biosynthesis